MLLNNCLEQAVSERLILTNPAKLIASGVTCVNDIRGLLGLPLIMEPWAWQHWMTKNYVPAEDGMNPQGEGGETA